MGNHRQIETGICDNGTLHLAGEGFRIPVIVGDIDDLPLGENDCREAMGSEVIRHIVWISSGRISWFPQTSKHLKRPERFGRSV